MSDKKGDDKKAAKADKKGDDKKKGDAKPKADKKEGDAKPKGGDDKKGGDKKADKKADAKPKAEDKPKADDKPAAKAEDKDAAPAAAAGDDKKAEKKGKGKEKKEKADKAEGGDKKADGKEAPVVETSELTHVDPNKPVEKPNKDQLDNDVKALEKVVKEIETTITRLSQQLDAKNQERTKLRASKNELFEEGKKIKEEREKKDLQVRNLTTKIEEIIAERKNNRQRLDATAKSLRYTNLDELEKAITQTELRIATSSLSLAAEKQLIAELKLLKAQRVEVAKFAAEKQKVNTVNAAKTDELKAGDVREKRDELRKQATALFKLEKEAFEKFSAAKSKDNELKRECDGLADKRRTNLKDKKTFVDKIYAMKREFVAADRAYYKWLQRQKKDKASANRARVRDERPSAGMEGAVGGSAPREHQVAYVDTNRPAPGMGNRRAKKERAAGADDNKPARKKNNSAGPDGDDDEPVIEEIEDLTDIVPYAAEKALCDKLVRYVTALQGKFKSADDAKDEKAKDEKKADHVLVDDRNKGFKGKPATVLQSKKGKGSDKLEDFFGKDVSKSQDISAKPKKAAAAVIDLKAADVKVQVVQPTDKKAAARAAAKKQKLTHVPDVFTEFKTLGLTAPVEVGQLEAALKALVEKKAYFESNPAADEVEAAAGAAGAAGDAAEAPADGAALADKLMDEEKAARVKEAEDLKAAAAKIAADDRKKAAKAADAAAEAERLRRVAEDAKAKKESADEENKERQRRKSLASEAEDAEQKRRVEEDSKAKATADAEEAKTRATGRRNSLQAQDEEQKRRIAAGEDHHDKPSVVAQVDAAEKKNPKEGKGKKDKKNKGKKDDAKADDAKAAKADAAPAAAAAAPAAAPAAAAGAAVGAELVKKVDADLTKAGFEPFTNAPASS